MPKVQYHQYNINHGIRFHFSSHFQRGSYQHYINTMFCFSNNFHLNSSDESCVDPEFLSLYTQPTLRPLYSTKWWVFTLGNGLIAIKNEIEKFAKTTTKPILSLVCFVLVVCLNTVQYLKNGQYLQDQLMSSVEQAPAFLNLFLYVYDLIGIDGYTWHTPWFAIYFLLTYTCLAIIEMNIGSLAALYFIIVCLFYSMMIEGFASAICENNLTSNNILLDSPYCCGSFILCASVGFVLFVIQNNQNNKKWRILTLIVMVATWGGCVLYEYFETFGYMENGEQKNCRIFFWHATNFLLGVFSGVALSN